MITKTLGLIYSDVFKHNKFQHYLKTEATELAAEATELAAEAAEATELAAEASTEAAEAAAAESGEEAEISA